MKKRILLNCDMGESFGNWQIGDDAVVMPLVDQTNIACGFHAGDFSVMNKTVALAAKYNTMIGAHPSYPDLQGFGRRSMQFSPQEVTELMLYQIGALDTFCRLHLTTVAYVKPHGALYNDISNNKQIMEAAIQACSMYRKNLPLMTLARPDRDFILELADQYDVPILFEAFADRVYRPDGTLSSRFEANAVYHDTQKIIQQALAIASGRPCEDINGHAIYIEADTLCLHGDNQQSVEVIRELRQRLDAL